MDNNEDDEQNEKETKEINEFYLRESAVKQWIFQTLYEDPLYLTSLQPSPLPSPLLPSKTIPKTALPPLIFPYTSPLTSILKNGVMLCTLMNKLSPSSVPSITEGADEMQIKQNLIFFIEAAKEWGVATSELCSISDILLQDSPQVLSSLESLAKAISLHPDYDGPSLPPPSPSDPVLLFFFSFLLFPLLLLFIFYFLLFLLFYYFFLLSFIIFMNNCLFHFFFLFFYF